METKRYLINKHLPKFLPLLLDDIKLVTVEQLQTDLMKQRLKPASINKVLNIIRHIMRKAVEWGMFQKETYEDVGRVKNLKGEGKRLRYLSIPEIQALLNACSQGIKPIVIVALNTGMRKGEILGLKWEQVDFKHNRILLEKTKNGER